MKKQITIDGKQSDWFEKAVFILKEREVAHIPSNLFQYAEHLVENQLKRNVYKSVGANQGLGEDDLIKKLQGECKSKREAALKKKRRAKLIDTFLYVSIALCFMCVMILLFKMYGSN